LDEVVFENTENREYDDSGKVNVVFERPFWFPALNTILFELYVTCGCGDTMANELFPFPDLSFHRLTLLPEENKTVEESAPSNHNVHPGTVNGIEES
jgi:hypothetical protein